MFVSLYIFMLFLWLDLGVSGVPSGSFGCLAGVFFCVADAPGGAGSALFPHVGLGLPLATAPWAAAAAGKFALPRHLDPRGFKCRGKANIHLPGHKQITSPGTHLDSLGPFWIHLDSLLIPRLLPWSPFKLQLASQGVTTVGFHLGLAGFHPGVAWTH